MKNVPTIDIDDLAKYKYLVFDGTFIFKRKENLICVIDNCSGKIIHGQNNIPENSFPKMYSYFEFLRTKGLNPVSITVDGNPCVIRVIKMLWPNAIIQRCIVHIQRQGLMWCRSKPKRLDAKKLRDLFVKVSYINSHDHKKEFILAFEEWETRYGRKIQDTPEHGYVFSDLKRARSMLLKALPNMFFYLEDKNIPSSTNKAEGYFSKAKKSYRNHPGLTAKRRLQFFLWHLFFNSI